MKIEFRCPPGWEGVFAEPVPSAKVMPEWIKHLPHDVDTPPDTFPVGTIRRCQPVREVVMTGYIIPLPVALHVCAAEEDGVETFNWRGDWKLMDQHGIDQAPAHHPAYKLYNPWTITTPPGYSTLFIPPAHHLLPYRPHMAIVDTDRYKNRINFPFAWLERPFDRIIDAGTPFIQAIPFARGDSWECDVRENTEDEEVETERARRRVEAVAHQYKGEVRDKDRGKFKKTENRDDS